MEELLGTFARFASTLIDIRGVVSPTWKNLGELAAIAVIRTFLNHLPEKDLEGAAGLG